MNINRVSVTSLALSGASLLGALGIRRPRILRAISFSERLSLVIPLAMVGSLIGTLRVARTCHLSSGESIRCSLLQPVAKRGEASVCVLVTHRGGMEMDELTAGLH